MTGLESLAPFLEATVRTATPLALAALGETIAERAGIINIGLEGAMIAGAFAAVVGAGIVGVGGGFAAGVAAGAAVAFVFALFTVWLRTDQIITGTAVTLGALGLTGALYRAVFGAGGVALSIPTMAPLSIPVLAEIPVVGRAFFAQPAVTYLVYALAPLLTWALFRTHAGLAVRSVGERPIAAVAAGLSPRAVQASAVLIGGALGGAGGATLVLAQVGTFAEGMSAGRGFIAIAIVALGRWHPLGACLAAMLFGAASALQHLFQAMGLALPYQLFLAFPYVMTLAVLAISGGRTAAPASLGQRELEAP